MNTDGPAVSPASAAPKPPDDPQVLREEIERTREQLGETVEALAAKIDVKAQAQAKLSQLITRLKSSADTARHQALTRAGQAQRQLAAKTTGPRQQVLSRAPEPVKRAAGGAAAIVKKQRGPLAAAAGAIVAAVLSWVLIKRWRGRS